ncbi:MAG: hypothetical protein M1836_003294 [Candelina mexicana]|nr:MAG: hypothetical protein M1836_003294 [Candelina mexicana]
MLETLLCTFVPYIVDLSRLNRVTLRADKTYASIGPGARWADVYAVLDAQVCAVPGGRVGAWASEGANPIFAARYGLVCDNVTGFEVVLGNGTVAISDNSTNPDGHAWGGSVTYPPTTAPDQVSAFVNFTNALVDDACASIINIWLFQPSTGAFIVQNAYAYTKAVDDVDAAANLSSNICSTLTFKNDAQVIGGVVSILQGAINVTNRDQPFFFAGWKFQPLPRLFTEHSMQRGGNVLGLDATQDNQIHRSLFQSAIAFNGTATNPAANDDAIQALSDGIIAKLTQFLQGGQALNRFQYLNYADAKQNPIARYGQANVDKLVAASKNDDPAQVFQKLVPGGFKLPTTPAAPITSYDRQRK